MPTFNIEAPNGKSYTIEGASAEGALAALRKHLGEGQETQTSDPSAEPADHGLSERQKLSPVQKALNPVTSYGETYLRMNKEARDTINAGLGQMAHPDSLTDPKAHGISDVLSGAGKAALGTVGYVASPITAAYRSVVGQPVEDVTGIPREYTEFAAQLATPGLGLVGRAPAPMAPTKPLMPGQEVAAAANRLSASGAPVEVPIAVASDSMPVQRGAAFARNVPFAGDPLVQASERTIAQLGDKAGEVASGYGGGTVVGSGEAARESIRNYITGKSAETSNKFYKRVDEAVDPAVNTELSNTRQAAQSILDRRANAAISDQSGAVKRIEEAITKPGGLNYEGIKDLRGYVRELKDNPSVLPADISGKELNAIYDGLSADLRASAFNAGGPKAAVAFDRANSHYAMLSERREALAKIIGTNGDAPAEKVFDRLVNMASSKSTADIAKLAQARKAMGAEDWNEFTSGIVAQMGRDTANFSGPERLLAGGFSPQRFMTAYGKLSETGKQLLFRSGGKGELANHLDDIARVSGRFKDLLKFANPSGTGQVAIGGGIGAGLMAEPITTISSVIGGRLMAQALSQPATAASVARLARAQETLVRQPSQSKLVAYSMAARNLVNTLGEKTLNAGDFIKALQGPVPARAQDEQQ